MRLYVNGVEIEIKDQFEVLMDLADDGEQLPSGAIIRIRGGPLMLHGRIDGSGLLVVSDQSMQIYEKNGHPGIHVEIDPDSPGPRQTNYFPDDWLPGGKNHDRLVIKADGSQDIYTEGN